MNSIAKGGLALPDIQLSKESLDLIAAVRPFVGNRGKSVIDTLLSLVDEAGARLQGMDIRSLASRAQDAFLEKMDSAVALFLILILLWLVDYGSFSGKQTSRPASQGGGR